MTSEQRFAPGGLIVHCNKCGDRRVEPGALVFSPPGKDGRTRKYHICAVCWPKLDHWVRT